MEKLIVIFSKRNQVIIAQWLAPPLRNQVIIAQWLARPLVTGEVPDSNPGKGENYPMKISY